MLAGVVVLRAYVPLELLLLNLVDFVRGLLQVEVRELVLVHRRGGHLPVYVGKHEAAADEAYGLIENCLAPGDILERVLVDGAILAISTVPKHRSDWQPVEWICRRPVVAQFAHNLVPLLLMVEHVLPPPTEDDVRAHVALPGLVPMCISA